MNERLLQCAGGGRGQRSISEDTHKLFNDKHLRLHCLILCGNYAGFMWEIAGKYVGQGTELW
jgi:hypothetical protein